MDNAPDHDTSSSEMIIFVALITFTLFGSGFYLGLRYSPLAPVSEAVRPVLWAGLFVVLGLIWISQPLYRALVPYDHSGMAAKFLRVTFVAMGFFTMLLILTLPGHLLETLIERLPWIRTARAFAPGGSLSEERREWLSGVLRASTLGASFLGTWLGYRHAQAGPVVEEVVVPLKGLSSEFEGVRIAQISDLHVGPTIGPEEVDRIIDLTLSAKPDLIVLTGDLVDGTIPQLRHVTDRLSRLKAPLGVFFITGNHEYFWNATAWIDYWRAMGFHYLDNSHVVLERPAANRAGRLGQLVLAGVPDHMSPQFGHATGPDPKRALSGAPESVPSVILVHQPKGIHAAEEAGASLQLSGHSHGGQFFPWSFFVRFAHPYYRGLHLHRGRTWIYVNRGTTYWGPPNRLGIPSEISLITLKNSSTV